MIVVADQVRIVVVCVVLTAVVAGVGRVAGVVPPRPVLRAAVRAVVQLAAVSAVITAVLVSLPLTAAFLVVMAAVATGTSSARTGVGARGARVGLAILAGVVPTVALLVAVGVVPLEGIALVPVGGILIGGAMTATTLSARRALDTLRDRNGEFEAALALGFTEPLAVRELVRAPAAEALVPALDQTRTVGLVTLPGAFVGMLLGGAPVWQAAALQLVVLLALLVVEVIAVVVVVELVAAGGVRRPVG
ncbi:ABC transporter permease [Umezawaea beigongshangensis]|uniref:ABC transporter permease n=1 Tax=Umezawaea beigongshangensis TaxID=2780383 RepID=UPI0018F16FAC|nr:ABC transporter permease [Umezawaea beigongshangensis]